jgi:hypothetical protein
MPTAITMDTLCARAFAWLAASTALQTWCGTAFPGRTLLVQDGNDPDNETERDECPAVAVYPKAESQAQDRQFSVDLECRLRDPRRTPAAAGTSPAPICATAVYAWRAQLAEFARVVAAEGYAAFLATNATVVSHQVAYDTVSAYPVVIATVTLQLQVPMVLGGSVNL